MKRTGEKALIISAAILNFLTMIITLIIIASLKMTLKDPNFAQVFVDNFEGTSQGDIEPLSVEEVQSMMDTFSPYVNSLGWAIVVFALVSLVLGIIAFVCLTKKGREQTAGSLLIGAGIFGGVISLTAILYYIAAVLCFVRKEKPTEKIEEL